MRNLCLRVLLMAGAMLAMTPILAADITAQCTYAAHQPWPDGSWTVDRGTFGAPFWMSGYENRLYVPNQEVLDQEKHLFLEIEYIDPLQIKFPPPDPIAESPLGGVNYLGWDHFGLAVTYEWVLQPQPDHEYITIPPGLLSGAARIDVGSYCIPEPATLSLLALGVLAVMRPRASRPKR